MSFIWEPSDDVIERANVTRLGLHHDLDSYPALLERSRHDIEWFWPTVVEDLSIEFTRPWARVLENFRERRIRRKLVGVTSVRCMAPKACQRLEHAQTCDLEAEAALPQRVVAPPLTANGSAGTSGRSARGSSRQRGMSAKQRGGHA